MRCIFLSDSKLCLQFSSTILFIVEIPGALFFVVFIIFTISCVWNLASRLFMLPQVVSVLLFVVNLL